LQFGLGASNAVDAKVKSVLRSVPRERAELIHDTVVAADEPRGGGGVRRMNLRHRQSARHVDVGRCAQRLEKRMAWPCTSAGFGRPRFARDFACRVRIFAMQISRNRGVIPNGVELPQEWKMKTEDEDREGDSRGTRVCSFLGRFIRSRIARFVKAWALVRPRLAGHHCRGGEAGAPQN